MRNLANWPKALEKAIALGPVHVLPGHGDAGGIEILEGQKRFLVDLYAAVKAQADAGKKPAEMKIELPAPDRWWFPVSRADLRQQDIETVYLEIYGACAGGRRRRTSGSDRGWGAGRAKADVACVSRVCGAGDAGGAGA